MSRRIYDYEYLGDPALDGSVRQGRNGDNQLVWERRESGVWTPFQSYGAPYTPTQVYPSYEAKILDVFGPSLVAYWPLTPDRWSEGTNGIVDVSGNERHATNYGAVPDAADGPSAAMGRAPWFDGTGVYINALANMANAFPGSEGTICCWCAADASIIGDTENYSALDVRSSTDTITFRKATANNFDVMYRPSGSGGGYMIAFSSASTAWHFMAMTWSQSQGVVWGYFDSDLPKSRGIAFPWGTPTLNKFFIGRYLATIGQWKGAIGHTLILDNPATPDQIAIMRDPNG
jgi:hypothetical protein